VNEDDEMEKPVIVLRKYQGEGGAPRFVAFPLAQYVFKILLFGPLECS
jgi:hypothetical protein